MEKHKDFHILTEAFAVLVTVPTAISIARTKGPLSASQKKRLYLYAAGTLLVDGFLLWQWLKKNSK
jgi:hypothetical protein